MSGRQRFVLVFKAGQYPKPLLLSCRFCDIIVAGIRIIFRCWQDRVAYEDEKYVASLRAKGSSLVVWKEDASQAVTAI